LQQDPFDRLRAFGRFGRPKGCGLNLSLIRPVAFAGKFMFKFRCKFK